MAALSIVKHPMLSRFIPLALLCLCASLAPAAVRRPPPQAQLLTNADVLPLAIDSDVQIRKVKQFFLGVERSAKAKQTEEATLAFERKRLLFGAITGNDVRNRYGDYFTFFWRTKRRADLTLRLEYRQQNLAAYVQAREVEYPAAKGAYQTSLNVTGDDYREQGQITAWRLLLVENHRTIVAFSQSYLWR